MYNSWALWDGPLLFGGDRWDKGNSALRYRARAALPGKAKQSPSRVVLGFRPMCGFRPCNAGIKGNYLFNSSEVILCLSHGWENWITQEWTLCIIFNSLVSLVAQYTKLITLCTLSALTHFQLVKRVRRSALKGRTTTRQTNNRWAIVRLALPAIIVIARELKCTAPSVQLVRFNCKRNLHPG